jgi:hypothetical protein
VRIRFATAADVFTAFPTLADDVLAKPAEAEPLAYFGTLAASPTPEDAVSFFAYLAPKREAVLWGCRCARALVGPGQGTAADTLAAAERWVREPEEEHRRAALALARAAPSDAPATWAAFGAGWSGGDIGEGHPVLAAPHLTAKATRACVLIAVAGAPARERSARLAVAYDTALAVAATDLEGGRG